MSVNVISSEDIENYKQMLEKHMADKAADAKHDDYYAGYFDGLKKAIDLAEKLEESKKVVIPRFVADWIEKAKVYYGDEVDPLRIIFWMGDYVGGTESQYEWMKNIYNQKLLLNAIVTGYEVEEIEDE
ncbi:DUF1642 domain-containing protein [Pediococcus pentosaceus]|uniref:DUF1642 domain-containing protein n=1 Tax=Pediococcus pentosaceus TaxID=1255 RepID=UPI0023806110|nr:DUF1642 domain-containing protein [Pediococcus pentosaceus]MDE3751860.1 DUF1642 domain-containing protein [Pediococcus pentosaceus]